MVDLPRGPRAAAIARGARETFSAVGGCQPCSTTCSSGQRACDQRSPAQQAKGLGRPSSPGGPPGRHCPRRTVLARRTHARQPRHRCRVRTRAADRLGGLRPMSATKTCPMTASRSTPASPHSATSARRPPTAATARWSTAPAHLLRQRPGCNNGHSGPQTQPPNSRLSTRRSACNAALADSGRWGRCRAAEKALSVPCRSGSLAAAVLGASARVAAPCP